MPYLNFLLERSGAPRPLRISIHSHPEKWVNVQIFDEITNEWPDSVVSEINSHESSQGDLIVLPFDGDSPAKVQYPAINSIADWVMLYGLERRRIWILPREEAVALVLRARRFRALRKILAKAKIVRPIKWSIQLWKKFCCA
jgi:hypothetical protein